MYQTELSDAARQAQEKLRPTGYKLLISVPSVQEKTRGGIYLPDDHTSREQTATVLGRIVAIGPDAYSDKTKFPTGAWCSVGDLVSFRPYSGTRLKVGGEEFRVINDDTVECIVLDANGVERA